MPTDDVGDSSATAAETALENGIAPTLDLAGQALEHNPSAPAVVLGGGVVARQPTYAVRIRASIIQNVVGGRYACARRRVSPEPFTP